jgi:hypothetical protein
MTLAEIHRSIRAAICTRHESGSALRQGNVDSRKIVFYDLLAGVHRA